MCIYLLPYRQIYKTKLLALSVRAIGGRYLILEASERSRTCYPLTSIKRSFAKQSTEVSEDVQASAGTLTTAQKGCIFVLLYLKALPHSS